MTTPLDAVLGTDGDPECRVVTDDVAVHWFPTGAEAGARCLCGATTLRECPDPWCDEDEQTAA